MLGTPPAHKTQTLFRSSWLQSKCPERAIGGRNSSNSACGGSEDNRRSRAEGFGLRIAVGVSTSDLPPPLREIRARRRLHDTSVIACPARLQARPAQANQGVRLRQSCKSESFSFESPNPKTLIADPKPEILIPD